MRTRITMKYRITLCHIPPSRYPLKLITMPMIKALIIPPQMFPIPPTTAIINPKKPRFQPLDKSKLYNAPQKIAPTHARAQPIPDAILNT